jgi:hypothetical protein
VPRVLENDLVGDLARLISIPDSPARTSHLSTWPPRRSGQLLPGHWTDTGRSEAALWPVRSALTRSLASDGRSSMSFVLAPRPSALRALHPALSLPVVCRLPVVQHRSGDQSQRGGARHRNGTFYTLDPTSKSDLRLTGYYAIYQALYQRRSSQKEPYGQSLELGRFVLADAVAANGDSRH